MLSSRNPRSRMFAGQHRPSVTLFAPGRPRWRLNYRARKSALTMIRADPQRRTDHYSIHWLRHILVRHEVPAFLIQLELSSARRDRFTIGSSIVTGVAWERV